MSGDWGDTPQATMDPSCIGPLFQNEALTDCWMTDEGESVWLWRSDLALVLTLDMDSSCPTCGHHLAGGDRWRLTHGDVLARQFFYRGYR